MFRKMFRNPKFQKRATLIFIASTSINSISLYTIYNQDKRIKKYSHKTALMDNIVENHTKIITELSYRIKDLERNEEHTKEDIEHISEYSWRNTWLNFGSFLSIYSVLYFRKN